MIKYFINISYSISIRQQYWLAKKQAEAKLKKSIAFSGNEYVLLEEVCLLLTSILNLVLIRVFSNSSKSKDFYIKKIYFYIKITNSNLHVGQQSICIINEIFNCHNNIIFYLQKCKTVFKNNIKHCLEVIMLNDFIYNKSRAIRI